MELISAEGDFVTLTIEGYQYPDVSGSGPYDWDANWLTIAGRVKSDESEWTFLDPCLTTWEAHELSSWLHGVAEGTQRPAPVGPNTSSSDMLAFTEPCLAFSYQSRSSTSLTIRVYISSETLSKSLASADLVEYFVELVISPGDLAVAADWFDTELRAHPIRL
jgi:hypothetical protein